MPEEPMNRDDLAALLRDAFAPWIHQLDLQIGEATETGMSFVMPENPELSREGGIVCGQSIAAAADTVGVLALAAKNNRFRQMTTVDMTSNFMRPLMKGDVQITVTVLSNGRRMATTRVDFWQQNPAKIGATATCVYAYLDG